MTEFSYGPGQKARIPMGQMKVQGATGEHGDRVIVVTFEFSDDAPLDFARIALVPADARRLAQMIVDKADDCAVRDS